MRPKQRASPSSLRLCLTELHALEQILSELPSARIRTLAWVQHRGERLPIHALSLGSSDPLAPTLALIGGVHGLESIGTQVIVAYLEGLRSSLEWDSSVKWLFERVRLSVLPLVNPVGMALGYRSNGNGVDLMRNAPVSADPSGSWFELYRGHRLSRFLPWFRGWEDRMEVEAEAVCEFVRDEVFPSRVAITLDVHSGFLERDRIWFPYARTRRSFPNVAEAVALRRLLRDTHRHHRYVFEPQSINYTTHGDLWDFIHDQHRIESPEHLLLPLTLELSSASWYRKNPRQLLSRAGLFHPTSPADLIGALHQHKMLFEFFQRALLSHASWLPKTPEEQAALEDEADALWFTKRAAPSTDR